VIQLANYSLLILLATTLGLIILQVIGDH